MTNRDYLSVDAFLKTELDAQALSFALRSGLIDQLENATCPYDRIPVRNMAGRRMLADLLLANGVIKEEAYYVKLTSGFRAALAFRDLLEAKLAFAEAVSRDVSLRFPLLIDDLPAFMATSTTFQLFRYDRCFDATDDNVAATRRWMHYTTALTRYEGRVLSDSLDLDGIGHVLDIGGNSGELAIQLCRGHPRVNVTVFDLPVVCLIGRAHVEAHRAADRIAFVAGDMRRDPLPDAVDAVTVKSLLHDWPERDAVAIVEKAARAVRPGGLLVLFERGPLRPTGGVSYADLGNLVFFHFFREPDLYLRTLSSLGFHSIRRDVIDLETRFNLITARRPPLSA